MLSICLPPQRWLPKNTQLNKKSCNSFNHACLTPARCQGFRQKRRQNWASLQTFFGNKNFCSYKHIFRNYLDVAVQHPYKLLTASFQRTSVACFIRLQFQNCSLSIVNCQLSIASKASPSVVETKKNHPCLGG